MKRILFVDDEQQILHALQNLLRKDRNRWDMVFVTSGEAALAEMAKAPFDLVVTDMRMPGMDGADLLRRVRADYPQTARVVLSGYAEPEAIARALAVAHQFLSKPFEPVLLRAVIERTCNLHAHLQDPHLRALVGTLDKLPSAPRAFADLSRAMMEPNARVEELARIIETDPAMAAKILQLANSSYFGLARPVGSIRQALGFLGLETVKGLALTAHVFACASRIVGLDWEAMQAHAVQSAALARRFLAKRARPDEAFTAGLLHDIGKVVLALALPEKYGAVLARAARESVPSHLVEKEALGTTHAEVGAYLLGVWGLPFAIVEAVAFHHAPSGVCSAAAPALHASETSDACALLAAVHVADALLHARPPEADARLLDLAFVARPEIAGRLPAWRALAENA